MIYLTHQPPQLATAAIYLAAREVGIKLPEVEWWEVFDTDREELGFLCVAMLSVEGFAQKEKEKWSGRRELMGVEDVEREMKRRSESEE
jgi:cyclin L